MKDPNPPKLATWLLNNFGATRHRRALVGDLLEEFRGGRSRSWFWRQALLIVARQLGREAFSPGILFGVGFVFLVFALPDYVFWRLHRPLHISEWVSAAIAVAGVLSLLWYFWSRRASKWMLIAAWIAWVWFWAWVSQDSLVSRLESDAKLTAIIWVLSPFFACWVRSRPKKTR